MLAVTFAFPGGSANCFGHAPDNSPISMFLCAGRIFLCEALSQGHLSGVCGRSPFAVLFHAAATVQAWSLCWFGFTGESVIIMKHASESAYVNIPSCPQCFVQHLRWGIHRVLRSPAFSWVCRAAAPVHALSSHG